MDRRPCALVLAVLLLSLLSTEALAQTRNPDPSAISLHAFTGRALLGHGDHVGSFQGATLMKQFHPLGFLGVTTGMISSSDLHLRPDEADEWRHRQFYLVEAMVHFDVVTIRFTDHLANRFSFRMGASYQYGHEETSFEVTGPGLAPDESQRLPDFLMKDAALYTYNVGGNQYDVRAIERSTGAAGTFMALEYSVELGPVHVALDGAYRHYSAGTPILSYGMSLGLRY